MSGDGEYEDASGILYKGNFKAGALHGHGSMVAGDMTRVGRWKQGSLHGQGVKIDLILGKKRGTFKNGLEHGTIKYSCKPVQGRIRAFYRHGLRHGRGTLNYGNIPELLEKGGNATESKDRDAGGTTLKATVGEREGGASSA